MPRKRSTYTAEFKLAAVRMMTARKLSVAQVARRRGPFRFHSHPVGFESGSRPNPRNRL